MDTGSSIALLLRSDTPSPDDCNLAEILDFFGIPWTALTVSEANGGNVASLTASHPQFSILTSAPCLAETLQHCKAGTFPAWLAAAAPFRLWISSCGFLQGSAAPDHGRPGGGHPRHRRVANNRVRH